MTDRTIDTQNDKNLQTLFINNLRWYTVYEESLLAIISVLDDLDEYIRL